MRTFQIFTLAIVILFLFGSCHSEKKQAAQRMTLVETIYQQGDTVNALAHLDSIRKLYPGAIQEVVKADQQKKNIYADILYRKQDEHDSLMVKVNKLEQKFDKEKTEFDRYTQYIHKRQNFKRRWNKSFIQLHLDERGELYISSNYYGEKWLKHTGLRVYDNEIQAKTEKIPLDDVNNHRSDFMDYVWEKVSYRNGKDNGVIEFIAQHADRKLKAVFLGDRYYYIWLEEYDKQAAIDALALSKLLKKKIQLEKEIKSLQSKVG